jgi:hypothetical protein
MEKTEKAGDIILVPFAELKRSAKRILSNTKKESDAQLAQFQAANVKKREAKKKR